MTPSQARPVFARMAQKRPARFTPVPDRVLMTVSALVRGGAQRRMAATALGVMEKGIDVRLIASRGAHPGDIDFIPDLHAMGIDAGIAPQDSGAELGAEVEAELLAFEQALPVWWVKDLARPFAHAILDYQPSVVHGWVDRFAIISGLVACALGVPRIVIGLTNTTPDKRGHDDAELLRCGYQALAKHDHVRFVAVSGQCADDHEAWLGLAPGSITTIYAGFLPASLRIPPKEEVASYRARLGIAPEAPVVGTVMRFDEVKDPALWIETAKKLHALRPDARFLIAGSGILEEAMRRQVSDAGLNSCVIMPGPALDIGLSYAAMDVFLMTSRAEGLSNALIEAQAAGRPVVCVPVEGAREAIQQGITGLIVDNRSPESLAEALLQILGEKAWKEKAARLGPQYVSSRFGHQRMVTETMQAYGFD